MVTDGVGNSSRHVDAAQDFQGLERHVWVNEIFLPEQGPRELSPASGDPDAYFSGGNLTVDLFYAITFPIMRNYVFLSHRVC